MKAIFLVFGTYSEFNMRVYRGSSKRGDFLAARQVNSKVHTGTEDDHTDQWEGRTAYYTGYLPRLYILVLSNNVISNISSKWLLHECQWILLI